MRVLLAILLMASFGFMQPLKKRITLKELMDNPKYEVEIESNGNYSGESVVLKIKSEKAKKIEVLVPAGTLFYPENEDQQTLVLPEDRLLVLDKTRGKFELDGFCTEAGDGVPSIKKPFALGDSQDEKLIKLLSFFKDHKVDKHNIQEAIWSVTDGESINHIYLKDTADNRKFLTLLSELTGQKVEWYHTKRNFHVDPVTREINREPVHISGEVTFSTTKKSVLKSKIIGEDGSLVYENKRDFTVPRAIKNITLDFNLNVKGWDKGTYYVVYYVEEGEEVLKQAFTI